MKALTKSNYMTGLSCPKFLWCVFNKPELIPEVEAATRAIFDMGHEIGNWAKKRYPGGVEIEFKPDATTKTKQALGKRVPIFEASFTYKGTYCKTDILVPIDDEWDLIEVKSSASVKPEHIEDSAFQSWILENCGIKIRRVHVMYVNNEYVKDGEIDPKQLLVMEDVTEAVQAVLPNVPENVDAMLAMLRGPMPKTLLGVDCLDPDNCPVCFPKDADLIELYYFGKKKWPLINEGIKNVSDLPKGFKLSEKQLIQCKAMKAKEPYVNRAALRTFLKELKYPLFLMDFETIHPGVPLFDGTRPYQQVPFQFSIHVVEEDGKVRQLEFLAEGKNDPRKELIEALKKIGEKGTVLAYNAPFEKRVINDLADAFPAEMHWLHGINDRMVDLIEPFRTFSYYHPNQHGSCSLKSVLPAMTGKGYEDLEIGDGGLASIEFMRITYGEVSSEERERVRKQLLDYCRKDTEALVTLLSTLQVVSS